MINYYKILEIPDFSDDQTIKKAYRTLSKKYHPDVNRNEQAHQYFIVIKEAYEYLSDPKNKRWLDEILIRQKQIKNQSTEYARKESQSGNNWPPPKIHYFKSKDRKSTRLNSSHVKISYAVFCLKKKKKNINY